MNFKSFIFYLCHTFINTILLKQDDISFVVVFDIFMGMIFMKGANISIYIIKRALIELIQHKLRFKLRIVNQRIIGVTEEFVIYN